MAGPAQSSLTPSGRRFNDRGQPLAARSGQTFAAPPPAADQTAAPIRQTTSGRLPAYPYHAVADDVAEKLDRTFLYDHDHSIVSKEEKTALARRVASAENDGDEPEHRDGRCREVSVRLAKCHIQDELANSQSQLACTAFATASVASVLSSRATIIRDQHVFNVRIPKEIAPVTDQKSSGRCWLFAITNVLRLKLAERLNLGKFELSQSYLFYWDKLERANYFLELIIDSASLPVSDRFVQHVLSDPVPDGGQWDMAANVVAKYGIVPHALYPDPYSATSTREINRILSTKLRRDAVQLRRLAADVATATARHGSGSAPAAAAQSALGTAKACSLRAAQRIITLLLGPPPAPDEKMRWEFYDAEGAFVAVNKSPRELAELVTEPSNPDNAGTRVRQMFSLVNDPRHEYGQLMTVDRMNNVIGGAPIRYVNMPMNRLKAACVRMLRAGLPVFFGSDVGKYSNYAPGLLDLDNYDYENAFNVRLDSTKADRLETGESQMTHAMVLTGVHVLEVEGGEEQTVRWRIENSYSDRLGDQGFFLMSDRWMDEFVYQAVISPDFADADMLEVLKQKPIVLPRWDPMGALA